MEVRLCMCLGRTVLPLDFPLISFTIALTFALQYSVSPSADTKSCLKYKYLFVSSVLAVVRTANFVRGGSGNK